MSAHKYRPYLTEADIRHILHLAKLATPLNNATKSVIRSLAPFLSKIENEAIVESYTTKPKESLLSLLGEDDPELDKVDMTALRTVAYSKWLRDPSSCSVTELEQAYDYRAIHNLLTPEEQAKEDDSWNDVDMSKYTTFNEDIDNDI